MLKLKKLKLGGWIRRGETGQALVEAAITAPVLFVILMGAAELARATYMAIEVTNAAQAGAEYESQNEFTMSDNGTNQTNTSSSNGTARAAASDAYNVTGLTTTSSIGYVCSDGSAASTSSTTDPTCPNGDAGAIAIPYATVTTTAAFDPLIHLPGLPSTFTLSSSATEICLDCA